MAASINDLITKASNGVAPVVTTLASQKSNGAANASLSIATGWPTTTAVHGLLYKVDANNNMLAGTLLGWKATLTGTTLSNFTVKFGTDDVYPGGSVIEMAPTSAWADDLTTALLIDHDTQGHHLDLHDLNNNIWLKQSATASAVNYVKIANSATGNGPTISADGSDPNVDLNLAAKGTGQVKRSGRVSDWVSGLPAPNSVTYNGNRSYTCVFNGVDLTGYISTAMRLMTQRTVAAPTQCTSLNGTTQFYSKTSPAGMTFTDNFTVMGWVKMSSYAAAGSVIVSRFSTSGWTFELTSSGQLQITGRSGGAGNYRGFVSYQSIPLNKWVHVAATLTMATPTGTIYIDGVSVPGFTISGGTNPASLVQAGNLEVGSWNGGALPFPGKIAQAAVFSAVINQATIQSYISQGLAGTETSLISAYSFNNSINDLNANANNLTANGSAVATNADSPFGGQANGTISSTLDYVIVTSASFSTNTTLTVQVPEGCTIPTSGGVSAVSYATVKAPYGMPVDRGKWTIDAIWVAQQQKTSPTGGTWYNTNSDQIVVPVGAWRLSLSGTLYLNTSAGNTGVGRSCLSTTSASGTSLSPKLIESGPYVSSSGTASAIMARQSYEDSLSFSSQTPVYVNVSSQNSISEITWYSEASPLTTALYVSAELGTL